eukprot:CAMPEP_0113642050 /NCGR_PEP_ID=MMETSP0017_2-20120614/22090_1 /TAXON_ID=2856 /ORGANISM="Cylindrotheca closterium" /LENGTH=365 /DNA_ID=CAMNT_0000553453 /DNA_START=59 /DNA_END=1156 /DNA_ORIENTATION=- /assembly_acc=CAM_ASM_000147
MKAALTLTTGLLAASMANASHQPPRENLKMLLSKARRLDDNGNNNNNNNGGGNDDNEDVHAFLDNYSVILHECHSDITLYPNEDYPIYGAVVFRMCPGNSCNANSKQACKSGHADFAVDIGTYVTAMMNDQEDNMNWDDQFGDWANYAECTQYDQENGGEYYVGPTCTSDKKNVRLAVFDEYTCQEESSTSFSSISNGWTLPYSTGGMVPSACISCYDEDQGGPSELCTNLYDYAAYRCESDWDIDHFYWNAITEVNKYGQDTTGCKTIERFNYAKPKANIIGELFFVFILIGVAVGGYLYYRTWWDEKVQSLERINTEDLGDGDGDDDENEDEDGDAYDNYHAHEDDDGAAETPAASPTGGTMA